MASAKPALFSSVDIYSSSSFKADNGIIREHSVEELSSIYCGSVPFKW